MQIKNIKTRTYAHISCMYFSSFLLRQRNSFLKRHANVARTRKTLSVHWKIVHVMAVRTIYIDNAPFPRDLDPTNDK